MQAFIGDKNVFQTVSLLLFDDQVANVTLNNADSTLMAEISVKNDGGPQSLEVTGNKPNTVTIIFHNWSSPLGMALNEVQKFGVTADKRFQLLLLAAVWKVGTLSRVDIQFMLGPN